MFKLATLALALATFSSVTAVPVEDARPTHSGEATYFYQNGNAGSCGQYHSDSDYIVAVSPAGYTVSNHCGKQVTITNTETGITATATAQILATVTTTSLVPRRTSI